MKNINKKINKNIKAYSLLEMLITLVVFAILMTMIVQVLILSIESGRQIAGRSKVRGDLSEIAVMIRRDFRNASRINDAQCGENVTFQNPDGTNVVDGTTACVFNLSGVNYAWVYGYPGKLCPENKICKLKQNASNTYELYYQSSDILKFDTVGTRFELTLYQQTDTTTQGIVLVTLMANVSDNVKIDVATQYRQVGVFTRNF